jgi:hypothetical protein
MLILETYYPIFNPADGEDNLFRKERNLSLFEDKYRKYTNLLAGSPARCLTTNRFHLPVKIKSEEELAAVSTTALSKFGILEEFETLESDSTFKANIISKLFASFFSRYMKFFNVVYNRRGSLFIKNFRRKEVSNGVYPRNRILYTHLKPVKLGFTNSANGWEHTYILYRFAKRRPQWLKELFGDRFMHSAKETVFAEYETPERDLT